MEQPGPAHQLPGRATTIHRLRLILLALFLGTTFSARAALQFDAFVGYDGVVPEACWFPIVCEIKNDGLAFNGVVEVTSGHFNESQTRRVIVELPTGTLKRIVIPVFSSARYQSSWDVRLLDDHGHVRDEKTALQPTHQTAAGVTLIGAIPRTATGVPVLRPIRQNDAQLQPLAARMQISILPDNPLVLEGMDTIYLNSEKATELNDSQIKALLAWLNLGGHLIVGIEQISDVNAVGWLRFLVPCDLADMRAVQGHRELQTWLRGSVETTGAAQSKNLHPPGQAPNPSFNPFTDVTEDPAFEQADLQVATGTLRNATVLVSAGGTPLIITGHQGRGRVTALMFSPERKPFNNWKNLPSFWSKLAGADPALYQDDNGNLHGGWSIDGVFGAMIDSRQVRKLPVEWLLLLLIAYLVVIGPLDHYWLKRIRRPMLTWITFPCYVVLFSLLIYFIGYKLRAGESEWNELHLVDVLSRGDGAELRGHSYASIYSPVNATYGVATKQDYSTFRGEFRSRFSGGGQDAEHAEIVQNGDNFKANIFVPVWTSQLYACDWWQSAEMPFKLSVTNTDAGWSVSINNLRDHSLTNARLVIGHRIFELGELPARQTKTFAPVRDKGLELSDFVKSYGENFQGAAESRQQAFGESGGINDLPDTTMAVSFISRLPGERFIGPPGLDLSPVVEEGNAVLLAWDPGYSPIPPLNQFSPRRSHHDTLWRVSVPIQAAP